MSRKMLPNNICREEEMETEKPEIKLYFNATTFQSWFRTQRTSFHHSTSIIIQLPNFDPPSLDCSESSLPRIDQIASSRSTLNGLDRITNDPSGKNGTYQNESTWEDGIWNKWWQILSVSHSLSPSTMQAIMNGTCQQHRITKLKQNRNVINQHNDQCTTAEVRTKLITSPKHR